MQCAGSAEAGERQWIGELLPRRLLTVEADLLSSQNEKAVMKLVDDSTSKSLRV